MVPGEFKKLVYESTFRKRAEGMSFVNAKRELGSPPKYHAGSPPPGEVKTTTFPRRRL